MRRILFALLNLLTVPGTGTWLAGRRKLGALQMTLSLLGLALTLGPILYFVHELQTQSLSVAELSQRSAEGEVPVEWKPILLVLCVSLIGILIYVPTWLWSGFTTNRPKQDLAT